MVNSKRRYGICQRSIMLRILLTVLFCITIHSIVSQDGGIIHNVYTLGSRIFAHNIDNGFQHYLPQMKNPCYLFEHEHELLDPLTSENTKDHIARGKARVNVTSNGLTQSHLLRCLPYYFVLGWPKCGTSDIYAKMMVHPLIFKPKQKEPMFFNTGRFGEKAVQEGDVLKMYLDFTDKSPTRQLADALRRTKAHERVEHIFGDHSTHTIDMWSGLTTRWKLNYSFEAYQEFRKDVPPVYTLSTPQLLKRLIPDTKFIILIRDPVERFYSLYKMHEATSPQDFHAGTVNGINWWNACIREHLPLSKCMYQEPRPESFEPAPCSWLHRATFSTHRSIYHLYLQEWMSVFPPHQFLFLRFEDYAKEEIKTINEVVFPFLELPKLDLKLQKEMSKIQRQEVTSNRRNSLGAKIDHSYHLPMLNITRTLLRDFYRPYNAKLARLLNDDKYLWNY